jgi:putative ABC transport system permease protein
VERLFPRGSLSPSGRIIVRNLTRRPLRTLVSVLGVGLSVSIVFATLFFFDSFLYSFDLQFGAGQRQDLTVLFNSPRAAGVSHDLAGVPGVERVEAFRTVPVRLRQGHRMRQVPLMGLDPEPQLNRILDRSGRAQPVPAEGVLLSAELAKVLGVASGDWISAEVLEGARPTLRLRVVATVDDLFGVYAYMDRRALARLLREAPTASGAHLAIEEGATGGVYSLLKRMPLVAGVTSPQAMMLNFEENVARNLNMNLIIVSIFAGIIAIGVVYNGARIGLSERGRELASLRVLGFTRHEIGVILLGEQAVVTALGMPVGYLLGIAYGVGWLAAMSGEVYRLPIILTAKTFVLSTVVIFGMATLAGLAVRRRLAHLDLIAVLKTRE